MVMVTRSAFKRACASFECSDISQNNSNKIPPWCSGKVSERRKPRKVPDAWEIRSSYPTRENIWQYLSDSTATFKCNSTKKTRRCCQQALVAKGKSGWILLLFLFVTSGLLLSLWMTNMIPKLDLIAKVIPNTKLTSLFNLQDTSVGHECCQQMRHLAAVLQRTEQALRYTQRLRKTLMLSSHTNKELDTSVNQVESFIHDAAVSKGSNTEEWGGRVALWGVVPLWRAAPPLHTVLATRRPTPADCWPFSGSKGEIIIDLPRRMSVNSISIEHVRPDTAHSAPKSFHVHSILENGTWIKTIDGEYKNKGAAKQYFRLLDTTSSRRLVIRVLTNHGNPRYTCLYRIHFYRKLSVNNV